MTAYDRYIEWRNANVKLPEGNHYITAPVKSWIRIPPRPKPAREGTHRGGKKK